MQFRNFGNTDLNVSVVGFGVWTVSTTMWGITDHQERLGLLRKARELGMTFFDTADVYGDGTGETILHEAFGDDRDELVYATKFGYDFYNYPGVQPGQKERPHVWTAEYIRSACEQSLDRLGTDYIDLYQLHNCRVKDIENDEIFETLNQLKYEGKIRHIGVALGPALDMRQRDEGIAALKLRGVTSVQIIYNLLEQQLGPDIFAEARKSGGGVMCRVPHASGILEDVYTTETEFAPSDHRSFRVKTSEMRKAWLDTGLLKVEKLRFLLENRTLAQAAIQFVLHEPTMAAAVPNIYDLRQLEEFAKAAEAPPIADWEAKRLTDLYDHEFYLDDTAKLPASVT